MEMYAHVRRYVAVDGHSRREATHHFGISRKMVTKMMENAEPPGYQRSAPVVRPKLDPYLAWITEILKTDQEKNPKQRHTAYRIFQRLRAEHVLPPSPAESGRLFLRGL